MTRDEATARVEGWVSKWRLYLDGGLHYMPKSALIDILVEAGKQPEQTPKPRTKAKAVPAEANGDTNV